MQGKIIKINSDTSYILDLNWKMIKAHIKGKMKKELSPNVGDNIEFEVIGDSLANIIKILPRKNLIYRPRIANVDQVIIVTSLFRPLFSSYILNKYIIMIESKLIKPVLLFTKIDLLKVENEYNEIMEKIHWYEQLGYKVLIIDNNEVKSFQHVTEELENLMRNKVSFFTGQTGAGKSTTLNNFLKNEKITTNDISEKLNRGKHTTTGVKIYPIMHDILIADTPGFSSFELNELSISEVLETFSIFENYKNKCKFSDCNHIHEIGCAVKLAVDDNLIPHFIYNDYKKVINELKSKQRKY